MQFGTLKHGMILNNLGIKIKYRYGLLKLIYYQIIVDILNRVVINLINYHFSQRIK